MEVILDYKKDCSAFCKSDVFISTIEKNISESIVGSNMGGFETYFMSDEESYSANASIEGGYVCVSVKKLPRNETADIILSYYEKYKIDQGGRSVDG